LDLLEQEDWPCCESGEEEGARENHQWRPRATIPMKAKRGDGTRPSPRSGLPRDSVEGLEAAAGFRRDLRVHDRALQRHGCERPGRRIQERPDLVRPDRTGRTTHPHGAGHIRQHGGIRINEEIQALDKTETHPRPHVAAWTRGACTGIPQRDPGVRPGLRYNSGRIGERERLRLRRQVT
jgi:hypothetical protein